MYEVTIVNVLGGGIESDMEVFLFRPEGAGVFPGVLLAQHIPMGHTGLENDPFTLTTAQRLADEGYVVAVPFIFHWWPKSEGMDLKKSESRDDWMVADMSAAYEVLQELDEVDNERIGLVGHCWGGRVAWLAACHLRGLCALAVFYGGNIKKGLGVGATAPIELCGDISCPVIGFFGNNDGNPSPEDVADYSRALREARVAHDFHQYEGAGHAFQNFPMAERYHEEASEDAWGKLLQFLSQRFS